MDKMRNDDEVFDNMFLGDEMPDWKALKLDDIDLEDIPKFVVQAMAGYEHDYDSIVHAFVACLTACAWAINRYADLSGFQATFVPMLFMQKWKGTGEQVGLKVLDYDNMLYPQYESSFDKVISKDVYERLVEKAKENICKALEKETMHPVNPKVLRHWFRIVEGEVPFGYSVKEENETVSLPKSEESVERRL